MVKKGFAKKLMWKLTGLATAGFAGAALYIFTADVKDNLPLPWPELGLYSPKSAILAGIFFFWTLARLRSLQPFQQKPSALRSHASPDFEPTPAEGIILPTLSEKGKTLHTLAEEAGTGLVQLGVHLKGVLIQAKSLATATGTSREKVVALADKNVLLMSLIFQIDNFFSNDDPDLDRLKTLFTQLKQLMDDVSELNTSALKSYGDSQHTIREMNQHITDTAANLLEEAKKMQKIKNQVTQIHPI